MIIPPAIRRAAAELLDEVESSCLEVVLVPQRTRTNEGGMIRVAASRNVTWYRRFCAAYPSARRRRNYLPDTAIRRANTLRALRAMTGPECRETAYVRRLLELARARAARMEPAA